MGPRTCAIITAYNSGEEIKETIRAIGSQVDRILVIDDHSTPDNFARLESIVREFPGVALIQNPENYGLGQTLNIGAEQAAQEHYDWILTLDDNGKAAPDMVKKMFDGYAALPPTKQEATGIIAPNYTTLKGPVYSEAHPSAIVTTITAGQLVKTSVWQKLKGFNEDLIIGAIDHDFSFRALRAGYHMLLVPTAILHETPGPQPVVRSILGKHFVVPNYSSKRYYYIYRNDIYLYKNYWSLVPQWTVRSIISNITSFIKIALFESQRGEKTSRIIQGCWDGLRGRLGKY